MRNLIIALCLFLSGQAFASSQKVEINGAVGKLSAIVQKPELKVSEKCPMVVLMHGFMGNKANDKGMLKDIADGLEKNGIASIRFDFNGHGESEGEFVKMTVLNEVEDAKKVITYVQGLDYVSSVSVLGHSQGGVVSSMVAGELGTAVIKCAVLMAPAAVLREDALRGSTMGKTYNPADPPEFVEMFGPFKLGRDYIKSAQTLPIYETACKFTGPVCVIHGTNDVVVPYTFGVCYHREYKNSELHLIEGDDHGFSRNQTVAISTAVGFLTNHLK